jgi:hypothetical protein
MTGRSAIVTIVLYGALAALCTIIVRGMFELFLQGSPLLALLALAMGSIVWGLAARACGVSRLALPAIALVVELAVAFEFKRVYVLDYVGGAPRSWSVFADSIFLSDLFFVVVLAGLGYVGWAWSWHGISARA